MPKSCVSWDCEVDSGLFDTTHDVFVGLRFQQSTEVISRHKAVSQLVMSPKCMACQDNMRERSEEQQIGVLTTLSSPVGVWYARPICLPFITTF
uniref:Uncharacterized protein n=1 Tax=Echinococcus granulosus TaxID=6210 RepID=U6FU75_ECHGR|nr:hypothetical protein EgrG_002071800 [Echinococcus granulosus]